MEVLSSIEKLDPIKKSILTVGSYDGIHRGHQKLLSHLVEKSKVYGIPSVLVTFDPHPRHILNKRINSLPLLMSLDQKLNIKKETKGGLEKNKKLNVKKNKNVKDI